MVLARVCGVVVSSTRADNIDGARYVIVKPCKPSGADASGGIVALDPLGVSDDEVVLVSQGSSTRQTSQTNERPVDALVVGIVDSVVQNNEAVFRK